MRVGRGAGPDGLNLQVIPFRERTDWRAETMLPNSLVWQVIDIFTTHNGSWDVQSRASIREAMQSKAQRREENEEALASPLFGIDQWARDSYLFPPDNPRYCTEGGADHDILVCVQGTSGERLEGAGVVFTSDGALWLQPPNDLDHVVRMNTKAHGWCNLTMFGSTPSGPGSMSNPPALGPWTVGKLSEVGASDLLTGPGMPWNWHVTTCVVYQATEWRDLQPTYATLLEALQQTAQREQVIQYNKDAALQKAIFAAGFVPNSPEYRLEFGGTSYIAQRAEHLATGEVRVYNCPVGLYDQVSFVPGIQV